MEKENKFWMCVAIALLFILVNCYFYERHESKMMRIVIEGLDIHNRLEDNNDKIEILRMQVNQDKIIL